MLDLDFVQLQLYFANPISKEDLGNSRCDPFEFEHINSIWISLSELKILEPILFRNDYFLLTPKTNGQAEGKALYLLRALNFAAPNEMTIGDFGNLLSNFRNAIKSACQGFEVFGLEISAPNRGLIQKQSDSHTFLQSSGANYIARLLLLNALMEKFGWITENIEDTEPYNEDEYLKVEIPIVQNPPKSQKLTFSFEINFLRRLNSEFELFLDYLEIEFLSPKLGKSCFLLSPTAYLRINGIEQNGIWNDTYFAVSRQINDTKNSEILWIYDGDFCMCEDIFKYDKKISRIFKNRAANFTIKTKPRDGREEERFILASFGDGSLRLQALDEMGKV